MIVFGLPVVESAVEGGVWWVENVSVADAEGAGALIFGLYQHRQNEFV